MSIAASSAAASGPGGRPRSDGHDLLGLLASLAKRPQHLAPLTDLNGQRPQLPLGPGDLARDSGDESSRLSDISLGGVPTCRRRVRARLKRLQPPRVVVKLRRQHAPELVAARARLRFGAPPRLDVVARSVSSEAATSSAARCSCACTLCQTCPPIGGRPPDTLNILERFGAGHLRHLPRTDGARLPDREGAAERVGRMGLLQLGQFILGRVHDLLRGLASLPRLDQHRSLPIGVGPGLLERRLCPRDANLRLRKTLPNGLGLGLHCAARLERPISLLPNALGLLQALARLRLSRPQLVQRARQLGLACVQRLRGCGRPRAPADDPPCTGARAR